MEPKWNLYVEEIKTGSVKQLTTDASDDIINGTSDWNNHEEFGLADCFQWSPDGSKIAYYQFDQSGVQEFALINYTDALYPVITKYKYPKPGQTNSAVRLGVVSASGGATRWFKTPGDPRNTYIPVHGMDGRQPGDPAAYEPPAEYQHRLPRQPGHRRAAPDVPGQERHLGGGEPQPALDRGRQTACSSPASATDGVISTRSRARAMRA